MSYKIAIGSSDNVNIDLKFGEVNEFLIYEVDNGSCNLIEKRIFIRSDNSLGNKENPNCRDGRCETNGCTGNGHGCSGSSDVMDKAELISDCRCVVCAKIGFQAQKQFERKAISVFDVECTISEALEKIVYYYSKIDTHQPLKS